MTAADAQPQEVLRNEIIADARRQAERLTRRAQDDADAVLKKAEAEAQEVRRGLVEAARAEAAHHRDLVLATVPIQEARLRAERTEVAIQAVRDEVADRLARREGFDVRRTLVDLAADALSHMVGDRFVLEMSTADRQAFGDAGAEEVRSRLGRPGVTVTLAPGNDRIVGGVVVRDEAGRQVWDNRLAARLDRLWPVMRPQVAAGIFPRRLGAEGKES